MKIKNISVKPICIGDVSLLPGETAQVEAVYADAVAFYISMGYVQEVAEKKTRGKAKNPDVEAITKIVKMVGGEFKGASDEDIKFWIELQAPVISRKKFGADYNLALALLTCHAMKMAGSGDNSLGTIANTGRLASVSEGGVSISFATSTAGTTGDAAYQLTSYGLQFIEIRNRHIVPIMIR